jgi:hypothetical protein
LSKYLSSAEEPKILSSGSNVKNYESPKPIEKVAKKRVLQPGRIYSESELSLALF